MKYDVDIQLIAPDAVFDDPKTAAALEIAGIRRNARNNYVAKFRDPATARALKGADAEVRAYFEACGFAFVASGQAFPAGRFDARFDDHMTDVVKRLQENLMRFDLRGRDWNGFDIGELMVTLGTTQPLALETPPPAGVGRRVKGLDAGGLMRLILPLGGMAAIGWVALHLLPLQTEMQDVVAEPAPVMAAPMTAKRSDYAPAPGSSLDHLLKAARSADQ
ncbi:hypothetical protein ACOXXX_15500 [Thalassococcus sp. BH17M4-6]|uniref:hypothetical protein n=1 Tax=Thalassococcus sp. BH17M4-6 TaxID=3413148 RepID=UPI003BC9225C